MKKSVLPHHCKTIYHILVVFQCLGQILFQRKRVDRIGTNWIKLHMLGYLQGCSGGDICPAWKDIRPILAWLRMISSMVSSRFFSKLKFPDAIEIDRIHGGEDNFCAVADLQSEVVNSGCTCTLRRWPPKQKLCRCPELDIHELGVPIRIPNIGTFSSIWKHTHMILWTFDLCICQTCFVDLLDLSRGVSSSHQLESDFVVPNVLWLFPWWSEQTREKPHICKLWRSFNNRQCTTVWWFQSILRD